MLRTADETAMPNALRGHVRQPTIRGVVPHGGADRAWRSPRMKLGHAFLLPADHLEPCSGTAQCVPLES